MLYFNPDKFDFWKIYDSIKQYYPIGINKHAENMFSAYPGLKTLENIIGDNIHNPNHLIERWGSFTTNIEKETGKEIVGTCYGQAPSFSSYLLLNKASMGNLTRTKELHFFVSLIGPFYSIIGQDANTVKLDEHKNYQSVSYLAVSPEQDFEDAFRLIAGQIENRFKGFRFVPFGICKQTIDGLSVPYADGNMQSIFHALFNNLIDITIPRIIGNEYYKSEDWIKETYINTTEEWIAGNPPI